MNRNEAIELAGSDWWKDKTAREIVSFQFYEEKLCMDFGDFHAAVEEVLGRPVWVHEFGSHGREVMTAELKKAECYPRAMLGGV